MPSATSNCVTLGEGNSQGGAGRAPGQWLRHLCRPQSGMGDAQFTPEAARWVSAQSWHPKQRARVEKDGSYVLEIPYAEDRELLMELLSSEPTSRSLSPEVCGSASPARWSRRPAATADQAHALSHCLSHTAPHSTRRQYVDCERQDRRNRPNGPSALIGTALGLAA